MKYFTPFLFLLVTLASYGQTQNYDLAIINAKVYDSKTSSLLPNQVILIKSGVIQSVSKNKLAFSATKTIDAKGKLVTPGFIDTHIHPTDVFGDDDAAPQFLQADLLENYRHKLTNTYLPYGVTTAMIMGQPENWLTPILSWSNNPTPKDINIYTVGGAIITKENRKPYVGHTAVENPNAARQKVLDYYNLGIRHIKLYWRLQKPEFEAVIKTADSLGMKTFGHIDQNVMTMDSTLKLGLLNYEHICTIGNSMMYSTQDWFDVQGKMANNYVHKNLSYQTRFLELIRFVVENRQQKLDSLINNFAKNKVTFSTTFHLIAEPYGLTITNDKADTALNTQEILRCKENFKILMQLAKRMSDKGIKLRIGTDCINGGRALQSEQLLMFENGFSIPLILQISTINGATALGLQSKYGSLEKGKNADILIWDKSPFDNYRNFLCNKTIIKDGIVFKN